MEFHVPGGYADRKDTSTAVRDFSVHIDGSSVHIFQEDNLCRPLLFLVILAIIVMPPAGLVALCFLWQAHKATTEQDYETAQNHTWLANIIAGFGLLMGLVMGSVMITFYTQLFTDFL